MCLEAHLLASQMLMRTQDQFDDYRESTIGAAFLTQTISLDENTTVKFEIWLVKSAGIKLHMLTAGKGYGWTGAVQVPCTNVLSQCKLRCGGL